MGLTAGAEHALIALGHLGGLAYVEVALVDEPLHDLVQQLAELLLQLLVALGVAGRVAPEHLEHVGGELPRVHERLQDRLPQRLERPLPLVPLVVPERRRPAGEPRLEQEIAQLVEQRLQVDRVGELGVVFGIGCEAHRGRRTDGRTGARWGRSHHL
jgi:hypothetical protein